MNGTSIAIPLGFLLLGGLLCWLLAGIGKGRWPLKLLLTALVSLFSFEAWRALDTYAGWPSASELPQRSLFVAALVREPNPARGDPGAVYLWTIPVGTSDAGAFSYRPRSGEPRVYALPYSREAHESAQQAKKASDDGRPILIERGGGLSGDGDGDADGNRRTYGRDDGGGFRLREAAPALPEKDH